MSRNPMEELCRKKRKNNRFWRKLVALEATSFHIKNRIFVLLALHKFRTLEVLINYKQDRKIVSSIGYQKNSMSLENFNETQGGEARQNSHYFFALFMNILLQINEEFN